MDAKYRFQLLYVGNEPLLSKASSALLRTAGHKVRVTTPLHATEAIRGHVFSAIVLCATLSCEDTNLVVKAVEATQPGVPIVSVHVGLLGDAPHPASSVVVDALNGPSALIGAIDAVTRYRQQAS
jgi:DNA-binding NtrC family response regulator